MNKACEAVVEANKTLSSASTNKPMEFRISITPSAAHNGGGLFEVGERASRSLSHHLEPPAPGGGAFFMSDFDDVLSAEKAERQIMEVQIYVVRSMTMCSREEAILRIEKSAAECRERELRRSTAGVWP